ncbi:MAG: potassium transporter TrkG [Spirochaetota bacterium]
MYLKKVGGIELMIGYVGKVGLAVGAWSLLPLAIIVFYPAESQFAGSFILSGSTALLLGYLGYSGIRRNSKGILSDPLDMAAVLCSFAAAVLFFAYPFAAIQGLSVSEAVFEAVGGLTATGISLLEPESSPRIIIAHRALLQLFGTCGFIALLVYSRTATFAVPSGGKPGRGEGRIGIAPGDAFRILAVLGLYIFIGFLAYRITGVGWLDAFVLSVSSVTTGGFSPRSGSVGAYGSPAVELVTMALMILGSMNLMFHSRILRNPRTACAPHCETRSFLATLGVLAILGALALAAGKPAFLAAIPSMGGRIVQGARISLFNLVSALTSTGFSTIDTASSPSPFFFLIVFATISGGSALSLSGGVKQARIAIMAKDFLRNLKSMRGANRILGKTKIAYLGTCRELENEETSSARRYILLYLFSCALGSLALSASGASAQASALEFASLLGNSGFSAGVMVQGAPWPALWTGILGMVLGRLEIYFFILALASLAPGAGRRAGNKRYV